jgi:hypothetical protein
MRGARSGIIHLGLDAEKVTDKRSLCGTVRSIGYGVQAALGQSGRNDTFGAAIAGSTHPLGPTRDANVF